MTIVEALQIVLAGENDGMTSLEAYEEIVRRDLYSFPAKDPAAVVNSTIRRHCIGLEYPSCKKQKYFYIQRYDGKKAVYGLAEHLNNAPAQTAQCAKQNWVGSSDETAASRYEFEGIDEQIFNDPILMIKYLEKSASTEVKTTSQRINDLRNVNSEVHTMTRSKTLKLFLIDGEPGGRIKCSLANWTGIAYKVPRTALDKCKDMDLLKQSGVYFLFGTDQYEKPIVYIGQAGTRKNGQGLLLRVQEPHPTIDYWTETIMFTTTNNSFGPTEISYLENRFCNMAGKAGRYDVKNSNDPNPGNITEETESELEEFIDYAKIVMGALGHRIFEPLAPVLSPEDDEPLFHFEYGKASATGRRTSDGFVVLRGSTLSPVLTKSCPEGTIKNRKKYADKIDQNYALTADLLFSSPTAAAGFVGGASLNGKVLWKDREGRTLKECIGGE